MSYSTAQPQIMLLYMLHINAATLPFTLNSFNKYISLNG